MIEKQPYSEPHYNDSRQNYDNPDYNPEHIPNTPKQLDPWEAWLIGQNCILCETMNCKICEVKKKIKEIKQKI